MRASMLVLNFLLAAMLVLITFSIHIAGLVGLSAALRRRGAHPEDITSVIARIGKILFVVMGLFALHSAQIWVYALAYIAIGEFDSLETALYFSTSTFTTVGFGDLVLSEDWRMLSAVESMNGFLLIGWSTAFLVGLSTQIRTLEDELTGGND